MKKIITFLTLLFLNSCSDSSIIYENNLELQQSDTIKLNQVKIFAETQDSLTVEFSYTYNHSVPANEIKLFVLPDHGYWFTNNVKIQQGTHTARAIIGISKNLMHEDNISESATTKLRFRFDHYQPKKYLGNVWGEDIPYEKLWKLP